MAQKVFLVRYFNPRNEYVYLHASGAGADNRLREIVQKNLSEYADCNAETLEEIKKCLADYSRTNELCGLWVDLTAGSESLWVEESELYA
jgi:hypothetical protein